MTILHIVNINKNKADGINVVVPKHIFYQTEWANVALLNFNKIDYIPPDIKYFNNSYVDNFLEKLDGPFNKPDLVIFHGIYYYNFIKAYQQLLKKKIPYIVIPHGSLTVNALKTKTFKKIPAHIIFFNRFIRKSIAVQFLSLNEMNNSFFSKKGIIAPNGIDLPTEIVNKPNNKNTINIAFIGRKNKFLKGLDLLVDAVGRAKNRLKEMHIVIRLYGPDYQDANDYLNKKISGNNLEDVLINLGPVYDKDKIKVFSESDIIILTSRTEGLPTVALEAMSRKIPVFITRGTGLYDDVKKYQCGWAAETNSISIVEELLKIQKQDIQIFGMNAFSYVKEKYDWKKIAEDTIEQYCQLVNKE